MEAEIVNLSCKKRVREGSLLEGCTHAGRTMRNGLEELFAGRQFAQFVEPVPEIVSERLDGSRSARYGSGGSWPAVVSRWHLGLCPPGVFYDASDDFECEI